MLHFDDLRIFKLKFEKKKNKNRLTVLPAGASKLTGLRV
jgi:hypothetical protein